MAELQQESSINDMSNEQEQENLPEQMEEDEHKDLNGSGDAEKKETINTTKRDDDERKLFIGGISWETTESDLRDYLNKYGNIIDINIKTDPHTGKSRGFGFVLFETAESVDNVLMATGPHTINGKQIDPKRAKSRPGRELLRKVFIGGMDPNTTEDDIRESFSKFGNIEKIEQPFDKVRNQKRNFCFLTFDNPEIVQEICKNHKWTVKGKECDVKKAIPSNKNANQPAPMNYAAGWGYNPAYYQGYGGGGGGYNGYDYGGGGGGYYPAPGYDYYSYFPGAMPPIPPHQGNGGKAKRGGASHASNFHPYSR